MLLASMSTARRSFWFALAAPAILLVGVFISETLFVEPSGRVRPGREMLAWIFFPPAVVCFAVSWFYVFTSLRARDREPRWLTGAVTVNLLLALWLLAVHQLSEL